MPLFLSHEIPLIAAAGLFFLPPAAARCQTDPRAAMRAAAANSIIIPEVKVQGVTLRTTLSDLRKLCSESDPNGRGVDLILKSKDEVVFNPHNLAGNAQCLGAAGAECDCQSA